MHVEMRTVNVNCNNNVSLARYYDFFSEQFT